MEHEEVIIIRVSRQGAGFSDGGAALAIVPLKSGTVSLMLGVLSQVSGAASLRLD